MTAHDKWEEMIRHFRKSGKSQRVWCTEQGLKRSSLRYWLERLDELSDGEEVIFAEMSLMDGTEI
jgi:hypothetical protein